MKTLLLYTLCFILLTINLKAQINGCTDPLAINYNLLATQNDGSCTYKNIIVSPLSSFLLKDKLSETSGLIRWNNQIWTMNDDTDINIYSLDSINGSLIQSYPLSNTFNNDWEEISQDSDFIYIGDFGNNSSGNRTDLKILRLEKNSILNNTPIIDTIHFSYSDQSSFTPSSANNTEFDCEAFVVSADSIYLFTKQWISNKTSLYSLPKNPGTHIALFKTQFDIEGLITGATMLESERLIALCGYSNLLQPFIFLLYDFQDSDYFSGNKRKITISLSFHQIEGITTSNGLKYYLSNEYLSQFGLIDIPQKIHIIDLEPFLINYLNNLTLGQTEVHNQDKILIYPNPINDIFTIKTNNLPASYYLINSLGQKVLTGKLIKNSSSIDISELYEGMYFFMVDDNNSPPLILIKK